MLVYSGKFVILTKRKACVLCPPGPRNVAVVSEGSRSGKKTGSAHETYCIQYEEN